MDEIQSTSAGVVHPPVEQQASDLPTLGDGIADVPIVLWPADAAEALRPEDWSGHTPDDGSIVIKISSGTLRLTPLDTVSSQLADSEAEGSVQRQTPPVTPADAISILRAHADYLDPDGADATPVNALTAATLRMSAQFLEDVAPLPEPPLLSAALRGLQRLIVSSPRDWGANATDAWVYAVLIGWDCGFLHEHIDQCGGGDAALLDVASLHGWNDATIAKARRYQAAVAAQTGPSLPRRQRLSPGLMAEMIATSHERQREAAGDVDTQFVPVSPDSGQP